MFRFTIRELVLLTVIVALALGWCINWAQLNSALMEERRIAAEERSNGKLWEDQATSLADAMRKAGWFVDVKRGAFSVQWPTPEAYNARVEAARERAGLKAPTNP